MANPQKEKGHLRIANELVEAFQWLHLSGNQWRLLWAILRFTYGWNKKTDHISLTSFEKCTGIDRRNLKRDLDVLFFREIIIKDSSSYITKYGLQKDHTKWQTGAKNNTSVKNDTRTSVENNTKTSVKNYTHKRQKTIKNIYSEEFLEFWENYPARNGKKLERRETLKRFQELKEDEIPLVLKAGKNYKNSEDVKNGIGIRDPKRFLRDSKGNQFWREWIEPETKSRRFDEIGH